MLVLIAATLSIDTINLIITGFKNLQLTCNDTINYAQRTRKEHQKKALHTKLLNLKKAKLQEDKKEKALRLKALVTKMNQKKNSNESDSI